MESCFPVDDLEIDRLLSGWRWLCPAQMTLVARNVFGELFLHDEAGAVSWLNATTGKLSKVAKSRSEFLEMAETAEKRREWFVEEEAQAMRNVVSFRVQNSASGLVCPPFSPKAALSTRPSSRICMSMFPSWETYTDKLRVCQTEAK